MTKIDKSKQDQTRRKRPNYLRQNKAIELGVIARKSLNAENHVRKSLNARKSLVKENHYFY